VYAAFAGDDIEFMIGGEVAQLPDFRPRLKELRMPLLVIAGRYDRALYPAYQHQFARYAPQAEFVIMERSGSFAHIEEPKALMSLVRRFVGSTVVPAARAGGQPHRHSSHIVTPAPAAAHGTTTPWRDSIRA
jgi:pimeloyl-ACP methyl ester carboxylesterase